MRIAIVYNRDSRNVINLFGVPNREKIGRKTIDRIQDALKKGGHRVKAFEGDMELVDKLEEFMPRVVRGERPGLVFNVSYGIQGQARYTHVPSILEMVGIPYVASGPLAHTLALDKVVAKSIFEQRGLPTPKYAVFDDLDFPTPNIPYPAIVKPKNEAVSFGLTIVNDEDELRRAVAVIYDKFQQPVLAEQYIAGREVNVGIIGNNPPEAMPPCLLDFGTDGPAVYTYEDKTGRSGRKIQVRCPAPIGEELTARVQDLAVRAFTALGCADCARVDMRIDADNQPYILEINSLPSMGEHGSYVEGALHMGLDFPALVNRLVEVAAARYFGTPAPPPLARQDLSPLEHVFSFLTERRESMEKDLREWIAFQSRTTDPIGIQEATKRLETRFDKVGLSRDKDLCSASATTWTSRAGLDGGTLLLAHVDVPIEPSVAVQPYRREPEWIYGEGVGTSRAPLVALEWSLRALRSLRRLRRTRLGVLCYTDEGYDCRYSTDTIRAAAARAARVLVLRPGGLEDSVITQRRGQRRYRLVAQGRARRPGDRQERADILRWVTRQLEELAALSSRRERLSVSALDIRTEAFPMLLPHRVIATLLVTYVSPKAADALEEKMRAVLAGEGRNWELKRTLDRPSMSERPNTVALATALETLASGWEVNLKHETSVWPSAAGLVPTNVDVLCGVGPVARDLYTPHESVRRISLLQRTLLLSGFLLENA